MTADLVPVDPAGDHRIDDLTAQWLNARKSGHTRDAYRRDLTSWLTWCSRAGVHPLTEAEPGDILSWMTYLTEGDPNADPPQEPEAGTTRARRLGAVSSWYRWMLRAKATKVNPVLSLVAEERPTRAPRRTSALSNSEAEKLLAAADADTPRAAAIAYLLVYTGIRVGELVAANVADLDTDGGESVLHVHAKGGTTRDVRLNAAVLERVNRYQATRPDNGLLPVVADQAGAGKDRPLIATYRGNRLDRSEVRRLLARLARLAGLPESVGTRMSPHKTRATYATSSIAAGLDLRAVQQTMGHARPETTAGYDRSKVTAARDPAIRLLEVIRPPQEGPDQD